MNLNLNSAETIELQEALEAMLSLGPTRWIWNQVLDGVDPSCSCGHNGFFNLQGDDGISFMHYWNRVNTILDIQI